MSGRPQDLVERVRESYRDCIGRGLSIVTGLSGGVDSVVLLHVLRRQLRVPVARLSAIHVNHQLHPQAGRWAAFCRRYCRQLGVPLKVIRVEVLQGNSIERSAREARYRALGAWGADVLALGHHLNDQAETVLLQLLRDGGPRGLSAMPACRQPASGGPMLWRPLLNCSRMVIEDYARRHRLQWVEDESNENRRFRRNFVRLDVLPLLLRELPDTLERLASAAARQQDTVALLDELACADLGGATGFPVEAATLTILSERRCRNALRYLLGNAGVRVPGAKRLTELARQLRGAKGDARLAVSMDGMTLRLFRGRLHAVDSRMADKVVARDFAFDCPDWSVRRKIPLPNGDLVFRKMRGAGLSPSAVGPGGLTVRYRAGGEVMPEHPGGPRRTLQSLLQGLAVPPWERGDLPLLYAGGTLVAVADRLLHPDFCAGPGATGYRVEWLPRIPSEAQGRAETIRAFRACLPSA